MHTRQRIEFVCTYMASPLRSGFPTLLNDLARSLVWNQGAPKKAQANSVFYTDGLAPATGGCLGPCRGPAGLPAPAQPIYYEPPDAVGLVATGSPLRAAVVMPAPGSSSSSSSSSVLVSDRCCGTSCDEQHHSTAQRHHVALQSAQADLGSWSGLNGTGLRHNH
ncbi:hypothetical protein HPB50_006032 [Hyalomma asiaticum]|uniref:Uncharacterized protein n=1 Tax=Hyalomma asiaticum TaxID=266040 RepID=A0ACB7RY81_HYAAI|nr:hypothetical protein HPB50_006032 [Hyalomma asiaticum]